MFISYQKKNGCEYATLTRSIRKGGKVEKEYTNLGRVIDKTRGIFKNRKRGIYSYNLATGEYGICPEDVVDTKDNRRGPYYSVEGKRVSLLVLRFGDIFFFNSFVGKIGILKVVDAIPFGNKDTLRALVAYYTLSSVANYHAKDWFELSYAKVLYPNAALASQRISEALSAIGMEESKRQFFAAYYPFVKKFEMNDTKGNYGVIKDLDDAILLDSCGLPNDALLPITRVSNHNGIINLEFRLIYVVQQRTGLPLFFRYVAGNVIDGATVKRTIEEMKGLGVNTKFALLDSGYYNGANADILLEANISFISRVGKTHGIYKDALKKFRSTLEVKQNLVKYNGRVYYIAETPVKIGKKKDRDAYGYFCLDTTMRNEKQKVIHGKLADEDIAEDDLFNSMQEAGTFMLVCTRKVEKHNLLGLYYTRNQVEEIFKIGKGTGKMLPICVESEETLRGHLLLTFISSAIIKILMDRILGTGWSPEIMFSILQYQVAQIYPEYLVTSEPVKNMNDIYKHFKIKCPETIPYTATADELKRMGRG